VRRADRRNCRVRGAETLEPRALLSAASLINLDLFRTDPRFAGVDGRGQSVVVIDTGADLNHPFFGPDSNGDGVSDRIVYQYDFADRDADASDGSATSHGSHVAGIVGSADATNYGVASGANLIILKVFKDGDGGSADMVDIQSALQWVEQNAAAYNIASVNLSLGSGNYSAPETSFMISDEFARLDAQGVIVVAAAGNEFFNENSEPGVSYPAADPHVIAVSAVWADNYGPQSFEGATDTTTSWDRVAAFSQRDPQLTDVFAPGGLVTSADRNGGTISRRGTSMASPFIAGAAAVAQQLSLRETGLKLTSAQFKDLLKSTGITINDGDDEVDNVVNTGANYARLNMLSLGEELLNNPGPPTVTIENLIVDETSGGTVTAAVKVRLSRAPTAPVSVQFTTLDGSARSTQGDFVATSGTLQFQPGGPLVQSISILITGDVLPEEDENFAVDLTGATGATIGRSRGVVVIADDDETLSYHNSVEPRDVNGDRRVSALDALVVINEVNARGSRTLPNPPVPKQPWSYYDVNNDGRISALDVLGVINYLNSRAVTYESPAPSAPPAAQQQVFTAPTTENRASDAPANQLTGATVSTSAVDAVFALSANSEESPFACNNRAPVYRETYRRPGLPRFSG
jgi:hypothetical protein